MNRLYQARHKKESLLYGEGKLAIVSGWTNREYLFKILDLEVFSVLGNLYSANRGIDLLLRNLIANASIKNLVCLSATEADKISGSVDVLEQFFKNGFYKEVEKQEGKKHFRRFIKLTDNSLNNVDLDPNIPDFYLHGLRDNINFYRFQNIEELLTFCKSKKAFYINKTYSKAWHDKGNLSFPFEEVCLNKGSLLKPGQKIRCSGLTEGWIEILKRVSSGGVMRSTRHGGEIKELIDLITIIDSNKAIDSLEELNNNFIDFPFSKYQLNKYVEKALDFVLQESYKDTSNLHYTYSDRIKSYFSLNQIETVINRLNQDPNNSAIVDLWDSKEDSFSEEPPCLNHLNFRIQSEKLYLTATFRSHDIFSAWYLNTASLLDLQKKVAEKIKKTTSLGELIVISQSAHVYDDCFVEIEKAISQFDQTVLTKRKYNDPEGNYIISLNKNNQIKVERENLGKLVGKYVGKNVTKLYREIIADAPDIELEHAFYLGTELQKAELAIAQNKEYVQDRKFNTFSLRSL